MNAKLKLIIPFCLLACGCSTTITRVSTSPENARVTARVIGSTEVKELGETPLTVDSRQLSSLHKDHGPILFEITKPGYQKQKILVTEYARINLEIHQDLEPQPGLGDASVVNGAIDGLFEAQRLAKLNRHDEAIKALNEIEKSSPQLAATYELRAGVHYLQKKYAEALDDYTRALQLNPSNTEARRMQDALQTLLKRGR